MQTISVRVPDEDLEWLLALDIAGARNPSDRIRSLIAANRRQREGIGDYVACVAMLRDFLRPFLDVVSTAERQHALHSEVVAAIAEGMPEIMAEMIAFRPVPADDQAPAALARIEADLTARTLRLFVRLLRLSVTPAVPAYQSAVLDAASPKSWQLPSSSKPASISRPEGDMNMSAESLSNRVIRLLSANAHSVLDNLEGRNPEALMNHFIRELDDAIGEVATSLGRDEAAKHLATTSIARQNNEIEVLAERIELAVKQGKD